MSLTKEVKALLRASRNLENFSHMMHEAARELEHHHAHFNAARHDKEKQHHLKRHYMTFAKAKKIKEKYDNSLRYVNHRLKIIEKELERLER